MNMKDLLSKMTQLNVADFKPSYRVGPTGDFRAKPHTTRGKFVAGTRYGNGPDDEEGDEEGDDGKQTAPTPAPASTVKRGRGAPKKPGRNAANAAGYSGATTLQSTMVGNIPTGSEQLNNLPKTINRLSDEEPKKKKSTTESLKDWIAMIDEQRMLAEAGLAVQPIGKPGQNFLITDPKKPSASAITTSDQAVVDAAKEGTLSVQEPGAAPAAGSGSQVGAMEEGTDDSTQVLSDIVANEDFAALYDLLGADTKTGNLVRKMYKEITVRPMNKYADIDKILPILFDQLEEKYGKQGMSEGKTTTRDNRAEAAGKKVTKDLEYDMKHKGKDDNKAERAGKKVTKDIEYDEKKTPPMAHIKKMCKDGKTVAQICKMHPNCNQAELKKMVADCKKKMVKEGQTPMKNIFVILDDNLIDQIKRMNGAVLDPDAGTVETWDENTFNQLNAFAQKNPTRLKRAQSMNTAGMRPMARQVGGTAYGPEYNLKEGLDQRLEAARSEGRAHGLRGHQHCGNNYDDMEEARCYHEGYKEGLDECYGIMPLRGVVGEKSDQGIMDTMDYGAEELDEMNRRSVLNTVGKAVAGLAGVAALGGMSGNAQAAPKDAFGAMDSLDNSPIGKERDRVDLQANEFANRYPKFRTEYEGIRNRFRRDAEKVSAAEHMRPSMTDQAKANYIRTLTGIYQSYINQLTAAMKYFNTMQEGELDEMNKTAYMQQQARKSPGKTFNAFGQTFHDSDVLDEFAFESLDRQLNALLSEGMTVSISKGQENSPDSVSINASDAEADSLLAFVKQAGLGIFGGDDHGGAQDAVVTSAPSIASSDAIEVVDDHDGMLSLIRKMAGQGAAQPAHDHSSEDYADEEETCNECGMAYESCGGNHGGEMVDEMESEDQMTYNVAEDNPPDTGAAETEQEVKDTAQANSSAASFDQAQAASDLATESEDDDDEEEEEEGGHDAEGNLYPGGLHDVAGHYVGRDRERDDRIKGRDLDDELEESYANSADDTFESDIEFMTNIISGGANGPKSTGQTTIPVVSTQFNRLGSPMKESTDLLTQWKKLSGLK